MAEKTKDLSPTIWVKARILAAQSENFLRLRENASKAIGIGEYTLFKIENGDRDPFPDEVAGMAKVYGMPELACTYCHDFCPLGMDIPKAQATNLDQIAVSFYNASKNVLNARDTLMVVAKDGIESFGAIRKLEEVISDCEGVNQSLQDMKVLVDRRRLEGK